MTIVFKTMFFSTYRYMKDKFPLITCKTWVMKKPSVFLFFLIKFVVDH